jgi:Squalene-hopene cyclase C-terminal domain
MRLEGQDGRARSIELLLNGQNRDGGWPYVRGVSWTEPTVYALLALLEAGAPDAAARGLHWLQSAQRRDGGWAPQVGVDESTWVTALVALLPPERLGEPVYGRAVHWLAGLTGEESTVTYRFREWLLGHHQPPEEQFPGWPWIPGAAAWVSPTCLTVLALEKACRRQASVEMASRVGMGKRFLLERVCTEGGWNHGSVHALGYASRPYPETTGMALTALRGVRSPKIETCLATARRFLSECRSADAWNWLRLGLLAHGQLSAGDAAARPLEFRTVPDIALHLLVAAAIEGRDVFRA